MGKTVGENRRRFMFIDDSVLFQTMLRLALCIMCKHTGVKATKQNVAVIT